MLYVTIDAADNERLGIPFGVDIYFDIELHAIANPTKDKWEHTNEERIEKCEYFKAQGNDLFSKLRNKGAFKKYEKALDWIDVDIVEEELNAKKKQLQIDCNNNLSLLQLKAKNYASSVSYASSAIELDDQNMKAYSRRGRAQLENGNWASAKKDLKKAIKLDKNNKVCIHVLCVFYVFACVSIFSMLGNY